MATELNPSPRAPFGIRPLIPLLVAPMAALGLSVAFFVMRSTFFELWMSVGMEDVEVGFEAYSSGYIWGLGLALVLALVVGGTAGSWVTAVVGMAVMATGVAAVPFLTEAPWSGVGAHPATYALALAGGGRTVAALGLFASIMDGLRGQRAWLGFAGIAFTYASYTLGGALGYSFQSAFMAGTIQGDTLVVVRAALAAGVLLVVFDLVLVLGAAIAWWVLGRSRPEPDPRRRTLTAGPLLVGLPLAVLCGLTIGGMWFADNAVIFDPAASLGQGADWVPLNTAIVVLCCLVLAGLGLTLHILRVRPAAFPVLSILIGVVVLDLGLAVGLVGTESALFGGVALASFAEVLLLPAATFLFLRGLHWRLLVPVLVVHRVFESVVNVGGERLELPESQDTIWLVGISMVVANILCVVGIALIAVLARKAWRLPDPT